MPLTPETVHMAIRIAAIIAVAMLVLNIVLCRLVPEIRAAFLSIGTCASASAAAFYAILMYLKEPSAWIGFGLWSVLSVIFYQMIKRLGRKP